MKWQKDSGKEPPKSTANQRVLEDHRKHGDRLPPGQIVTEKWPVLQYGSIPKIDLAKWTFKLFGKVEAPVTLDWKGFNDLAHGTVVNDIHCVTHWSRFDNTWEGIPAAEVLKLVRIRPEADFVMVHAFDGGYTTNIPLEVLRRPESIFAFHHDGKPLSEEHGWPCRLVVPEDHYFWKSAKWVSGLEFMTGDRPGFWERNGYHMNGNPFREERYG